MFSGEIYYYWPLNSVDKIVGKHVFLCIIYSVTNAVAVMYSRNIPMAEKRKTFVWFKAKKWKYVDFNRYFDFKQLLYIFEDIFWNICN